MKFIKLYKVAGIAFRETLNDSNCLAGSFTEQSLLNNDAPMTLPVIKMHFLERYRKISGYYLAMEKKTLKTVL
jgi:hypothetical protein